MNIHRLLHYVGAKQRRDGVVDEGHGGGDRTEMEGYFRCEGEDGIAGEVNTSDYSPTMQSQIQQFCDLPHTSSSGLIHEF